MAQGLGGFGNVNARMPMPMAGGATASAPVGAILQRLMSMYGGQRQAPAPAPAPPPGFDAQMAEMLGLKKRELMQPPQGMPMESWIGAR